MTDRSYVERNAAARERLRATIAQLAPEDLARDAGDGWTVSALLAHGAFWDRMVARRWAMAAARGERIPMSLADEVADLVNDSAIAGWRALDGQLAGELALEAADAVDELVAGLSDEAVDEAVAAGLPRLLERSPHRAEHLDAIDRALGNTLA